MKGERREAELSRRFIVRRALKVQWVDQGDGLLCVPTKTSDLFKSNINTFS